MSAAAHSLSPNEPPGVWFEVAHVGEIPRRSARTIRWNDVQIAIFRSASNRFFALKDECPHKQGPLSEGIVHGEKVTCPLHAWVLELSTGEATGADVGCTERFEVKVEDEIVRILLPARSN